MRGEARPRSNGTVVLTERVLAGRYRLLEIIGQGGMAVVHLAHDELLDRDVAVKVLRPGFAEDPEFVARFRREARHAASLHHPNIVTIYDTGIDAETGSDYIVMQLIDGPDLQEILERSGAMAVKHPTAAKKGKIAIGLGVAAILVGIFFFTLNIAMR